MRWWQRLWPVERSLDLRSHRQAINEELSSPIFMDNAALFIRVSSLSALTHLNTNELYEMNRPREDKSLGAKSWIDTPGVLDSDPCLVWNDMKRF